MKKDDGQWLLSKGIVVAERRMEPSHCERSANRPP